MPMNTHKWLEAAGFCGLFGVVAWSWLGLAPAAPWTAYALDPAYFALVAVSITAPLYAGLRLLPRRRPDLERMLLAAFLAGMPVIYLWAALRAGDGGGVWLELLGLFVYGAWALLGWRRRSLLLLAAGIAAHGLAWDAWHHGRAAYIEHWYPLDCLVVDLALGLLLAIQAFAVRGAQAVPQTVRNH